MPFFFFLVLDMKRASINHFLFTFKIGCNLDLEVLSTKIEVLSWYAVPVGGIDGKMLLLDLAYKVPKLKLAVEDSKSELFQFSFVVIDFQLLPLGT